MSELKTTIGLEIHVQLKTGSKMFCRCDNDAEGKEPNTTVCPVCLGLPGALPVANKQAVIWTIKTGLALNCRIGRIAKFDRKHYFYPDLPKGYQISQYDEPLCIGGYLEIENRKIKLNRIHLEEDAGKLIHDNSHSLVDLNRAGTPLMEIVTEPDIHSIEEAGKFLRKLQKIVRDVAEVSDANMEKGNLRCDANISVSDREGKMSEIVELKNLNSFRFIEKALKIEEDRLKGEYPNWPEKIKKVTRGYDSKKNLTYAQREKEEAADYRYFPEPDLPPIDTSIFDLNLLRQELSQSEDDIIQDLSSRGVGEVESKYLAKYKETRISFLKIEQHCPAQSSLLAKAIAHNYFGFSLNEISDSEALEYAKAINGLSVGKISKISFTKIVTLIHSEHVNFESALKEFGGDQVDNEVAVGEIIERVLSQNSAEVDRFRKGERQLFGFFMGQIMKETKGRVNPAVINKTLLEKLK